MSDEQEGVPLLVISRDNAEHYFWGLRPRRSQTWEIPANRLPTLPQRHEGGPQLLNEQVGLFKGGKVTTPIKLIPVDQV
jgi:hypothetical protein